MAVAPGSILHAEGNVRYWLRAARIFSLASFLLMVLISLSFRPLRDGLFLAAMFLALFFLLLMKVRGKPPRIALGLAQVFGMLFLLVAVLILLIPLTSKPGSTTGQSLEIILSGALALAQAAVIVSATRTLSWMKRAVGERTRWIRVFANVGILVFIVLALAAMSIPMLVASRKVANEKSAVSALHDINRCAAGYAKSHLEQAYPASLSEMGPTGSGCLDAQVALGEHYGYRFAYTAIDIDPSGRTTTYAAKARPIRYDSSGRNSFYTDESGKIRSTLDNREPTAVDSLVNPLLDRP